MHCKVLNGNELCHVEVINDLGRIFTIAPLLEKSRTAREPAIREPRFLQCNHEFVRLDQSRAKVGGSEQLIIVRAGTQQRLCCCFFTQPAVQPSFR